MKKKKSLTLIITIIFIFTCASSVFAYTLWNYGYFAYPACFNYEDLDQPYYGNMYNAVNNWNNTSCGHYFAEYDNSSANIALTSYSTQTYWGMYGIFETAGTNPYHLTSKFKISLNTRRLDGNSNYQLSTSTHEIGHALGLNDLTSGTAIMNNNRNRNTITTPQSDDVNGANANYHRY